MKEKIMEYLDDVYKINMHMQPINPEELSTKHLTVTAAFIGLSPESSMYGKIIGFIKDESGDEYEFWFHVHEPKQKYAHLSNKMTNIEKVIWQEKYDAIYPKKVFADFGEMAFWDYTPMDYLKEQEDESHWMLRELMENIVEYSRKNQFCQRLRKTDKKRLKVIEEKNNHILNKRGDLL